MKATLELFFSNPRHFAFCCSDFFVNRNRDRRTLKFDENFEVEGTFAIPNASLIPTWYMQIILKGEPPHSVKRHEVLTGIHIDAAIVLT